MRTCVHQLFLSAQLLQADCLGAAFATRVAWLSVPPSTGPSSCPCHIGQKHMRTQAYRQRLQKTFACDESLRFARAMSPITGMGAPRTKLVFVLIGLDSIACNSVPMRVEYMSMK